jgi:hypothetical protein
MTWTFGTSTDSNNSNVKKTCWMTVAIIISILIFIFIINDFFMKKESKEQRELRELREQRQQKNVKFYDDDDSEQEDNKIIKKNRCSV